jgi:hypothetical protein
MMVEIRKARVLPRQYWGGRGEGSQGRTVTWLRESGGAVNPQDN